VAEVVYSRHAFADLERLAGFLLKDAPEAAIAAIDVIRDGIEILERHPLVGRPCEEGLKELLISYGKGGYVALYWCLPFVISGKQASQRRVTTNTCLESIRRHPGPMGKHDPKRSMVSVRSCRRAISQVARRWR